MKNQFGFDHIEKKIKKRYIGLSREHQLIGFFGLIFLIIIARLFYLQIVVGDYYSELLAGQHYTSSRLQAERGQIYVTDKAGKQLQMTENVEYFTLFIDPKFVDDDTHKDRIVDILTPIVYDHLCVIYGLEKPDQLGCIKNIETFAKRTLLPDKNTFYTYSGDALVYVDTEQYQQGVDRIVETFSEESAKALISEKLKKQIQTGVKDRNFLGQFENESLLNELGSDEFSGFVDILSENYVYIRPSQVTQLDSQAKALRKILRSYEYAYELSTIKAIMQEQEIRYIRILTNMNAKIAKRIKDAKKEFYDEKVDFIPVLHGLGLETFQKRYYPHGSSMAHILGYVDKQDQSFYGVEEFYDEKLRGKDGKIRGLATPWIGQIGANSFDIQEAKNGTDIYLTINPFIQQQIESLTTNYRKRLRADSVSITIIDPHTGKVKGMANAPTFDPNNYETAYKLKPLPYNERYIVDDLTYSDIPIYYFSGDVMNIATSDQRSDISTKKYIFENYLGPQVFVDKNISFPYEPGSIIKGLTLGIGIDSDSINLYDFYNDPGFVKIGPYTIANIDKNCTGDNTFMHALGFSCNVGMVRIAQKVTKYIFYSYFSKLGFGKKTGIELANEDPGTLPDFNTVSKARYFNNTFGQGFLASPLQIAAAYSALVNGGTYIEPTVVEAMYDKNTKSFLPLGDKKKVSIFKKETSEEIKEALVGVIDSGGLKKYKKEGLSLGGKTGTSEIAYKGRYQGGAGWTNGSFVGIVTAENLKYVIAIQVRRPRSSPWGADTAGKIFSELADFLLSYDTIDQ